MLRIAFDQVNLIKGDTLKALAQQFHTLHFGFDAASAVVAAPSSPERTAEVFRRPQGLVAGDCTCGASFPRLGVPVLRNDGGCAAFGPSRGLQANRESGR